jgi:hypothetical protein
MFPHCPRRDGGDPAAMHLEIYTLLADHAGKDRLNPCTRGEHSLLIELRSRKRGDNECR